MLKHRYALILTGICVSILFTWLSVRGTDLPSIVAALTRGDLSWAVVFLGLLSAFCVFKAIRWSVLLQGVDDATTIRLLPTVLIGYFGTVIMPMQLGEILRAHSAAQRLKSPFMTILSSLVVERVFDVLGLVLLVAAGILYGSNPGDTVWYGGALVALASLVLLVVLILAVARPKYVHSLAAFVTRPASPRFQKFIVRNVDAGLAGLVVLKKPSKFAELLLLSVVQWVFMWGCVWTSLQAFDLNLQPAATLAVLAAIVVGMFLPAGPGYIGTIQLAFTLTLAPFGVSNADALAASLFYQVMLCVPLAVAGALSLRGSDLRLSRMIEVDGETGEFRASQLSVNSTENDSQ